MEHRQTETVQFQFKITYFVLRWKTNNVNANSKSDVAMKTEGWAQESRAVDGKVLVLHMSCRYILFWVVEARGLARKSLSVEDISVHVHPYLPSPRCGPSNQDDWSFPLTNSHDAASLPQDSDHRTVCLLPPNTRGNLKS